MSTRRRLIWVGVGLVVFIIAATPAYYFYRKYEDTKRTLSQVASGQQNKETFISKIGNHILLPQGEDPTLVSITDVGKLQSQQFFQNAKDGDILLVYTKAKKAILYRPGIDKIVEVAPVTSASASGAAVTSASVTTPTSTVQTMRFVISNGTKSVGFAKRYEASLSAAIANADITALTNANSDAYTTTIIVDLSGNRSSVVATVAGKLGIQVGSLPSTETAPKNADFLIILGGDKL